jgi:hypothetical protein
MTVDQVVRLIFLLVTGSLMYDVVIWMGAVDVGTGLIDVLPYRTVIEDEYASLIHAVENQVMSLFCA